MQRLKTDPARFEVVKNALTCAAEEMKIVLAKTAYSPLLKVAGDYSCGIFDIARQHGRTGPGSADPSRLDAGCGARGRAARFPMSHRATCSSTTIRIRAARICRT